MPATKLVVTTQPPASIPAGVGASYPYVPMVVQAQDAGSVLDTAYGVAAGGTAGDGNAYCQVALTTPGGAVLSGPDRAYFFAGAATVAGIAVSAPGTYTYTITSSTGLTGTVSGSFTVTSAVDTFFNPDSRMRGLGAALPRSVPSTTRPATGTVRYVGPSETYTTIQAAVTAAAAAGGAQTIKLRAGQTLSEEVVLPAYSGPGITITSDGWSKTAGQRVSPSDFTTQAIWQNVNTNGAIFKAPSGANNYWFVGLHCRSNPSVAGNSALALLGFDDGDALASGVPSGLSVDQCYFHHDDPTSAHVCARAIRWRAQSSAIINSYFIGFQRTALPDAQSILCDNTPGNLLLDNNYIEGESEGFMIGGTDFLGAQYVPFDVTITRNYFTKPIAQIGVWQPKNLLELKAGHRIKVRGNIFDGFWDANVSQWSALNVKSVNQSSNPVQAYTGTSDVAISNNFFRNIPDMLSCSGSPQGPVEIVSRVVFHNLLAANVNSTTWSNGVNGDGMLGHFSGFFDGVFDHLSFVSAPNATQLRELIFGNFSQRAFRSTISNVLIQTDKQTNTVIAISSGSPNMNGIVAFDPDAVFATNYYGGLDPGWVSYNQTNSPAGNQFVAGNGSNVAPDPGFTNYAIRSTAATADPLTICDAFVLASGTAKGAGTGGSDIGVADMAALKTAITGVMTGVYSGPDHLALTTQPSASTLSGIAHAQQPAGAVKDATNATVTSDTSTVTASWVNESGSGTAAGTLTATAVAGGWAFTNLAVTSAAGCTGHWVFTDGSLASVSSNSITITPVSVGTATQLAFTAQPVVFQHNAALSPAPVVTLRDAAATAVPTAQATVTLSLIRVAGTGELTGTVSLPTASGQASYSGVVVNAMWGTFRLKAEAPGFPAVYSEPFSLVEPVPTATTVIPLDLLHGDGLLKH